MSTFLNTITYQAIMPGLHAECQIRRLTDEVRSVPKDTRLSLQDQIIIYMNKTGISYTEEDTANLHTLYLSKYGHDAGNDWKGY